MKFTAILSKTTTDNIKSKLRSNQLAELVFEVYTTPTEYARFVEKFYDKEFEIHVQDLSD
jgi:hypothetical protein